MIQTVTIILSLFFTYKIFSNKGNYISLLWVIIPMVLINGMVVVIDFPLIMPISRWLIFSLLLTHLYYWKKLKRNWNFNPLKSIIIITIIGSFMIGIFDPRLSVFNKFYAPIRDITESYFILFLGYCSISDEDDLQKMIKPLYYTLFIISIYGAFNFIAQTNPYYEFVIDNFFQGGETDLNTRLKVLDVSQDRYRSISTFSSTFNYGYVSTLFALLYFHWFSVFNKRKIIFIGFFLGLIGTVLCFSRTVLLACFFSILIYMLMSFKLSKMFYWLFMSIILFGIAYSTIPVVQNNVNNVLDIFITGGEQTSGSSIQMRQVQTLVAIHYFTQQPIRGNGYDYINNELGWGDRDNAILDSNMAGFESILYVWLIEQGLIGLVTKLLFFISIIIFFWKKRLTHIKLSGIGLSIISLFLMFAIGTGALGAWPLTMLFTGVLIKTIQIKGIVK